MPRMTSKSIIPSSTRSTKVTFWDIMTGQLLYTYLATIETPTGVDTKKGSTRVSRLTLKLMAIYRVTKERGASGSSKAYTCK